jgi:hypothetical protein
MKKIKIKENIINYKPIKQVWLEENIILIKDVQIWVVQKMQDYNEKISFL